MRSETRITCGRKAAPSHVECGALAPLWTGRLDVPPFVRGSTKRVVRVERDLACGCRQSSANRPGGGASRAGRNRDSALQNSDCILDSRFSILASFLLNAEPPEGSEPVERGPRFACRFRKPPVMVCLPIARSVMALPPEISCLSWLFNSGGDGEITRRRSVPCPASSKGCLRFVSFVGFCSVHLPRHFP